MLINRVGGGGGSFDITNGRIEDLYAMDEDVPANTFVELLDYLHGNPEYPALTNVGNAQFDIGTETARHVVKLSDNKYLFFSDTDVRLATIEDSTVTQSGAVQITSKSYISKDAARASDNAAVVVYTTGWTNPRALCFIVTVNELGNVSVSGEIFLTPNIYTIKELKIEHVSENSLYAFWTYNKNSSQTSVHTLSGCGIYVSGNSATIGEMGYFAIDDFTGTSSPSIETQNLSNETVLCAISSSNVIHSLICRISSANGNVTLEYATSLSRINIPATSLSYCRFAPIDSFGYLILYSYNNNIYAAIASEQSTGDGHTQLQLGQSVIIAQGANGTSVGADVTSYYFGNAIKLSNSLFCVSLAYSHGVRDTGNAISNQSTDEIAIFLDISTGVINKTGETLLFNDSPSAYNVECLFKTTDDKVVFIGKRHYSAIVSYEAYVMGEFISVVQKSMSKIDGITKTKATPDQKGKVWLLDSPGI